MLKVLLSAALLLSTSGIVHNEDLKADTAKKNVTADPGGGGHFMKLNESTVAYQGATVFSLVDPGGGGH